MPVLYNRATQQPEQVPDEAVTQAISSGGYDFFAGDKINVVDEYGEAASIAAEDASSALGSGAFRYETGDEGYQRKLKQKYGTSFADEALAAAEGAARGLTFGASDVALTALGEGLDIESLTPEALAARREFNPAASTTGEVVGAVAPLLTGAGGAVSAGVRGAGVGVRGVAAAGRLAEAGVSRALGETAGRSLLGRALAAGAGGAVEGAAFGAGAAISEEALNGGDVQLTAEQWLAHVGMGAVLGGASAGVLTGGAEGALRLGKYAVGKTSAQVRQLWESATGIKAAPGLGDEVIAAARETTGDASIAGTITSEGEGLGKLAVFAKKEARQSALKAEERRVAAVGQLSELVDESNGLFGDIVDQARGALKHEKIRKIVQRGNEDEVVGMVSAHLQAIERKLGEIAELPGTKNTYVRQVQKLHNDYKKLISRHVVDGEDVNAKLFNTLDQYKRSIGAVVKNKTPSGADELVLRHLQALYDGKLPLGDGTFEYNLLGLLENQRIWGKEAAELQARINARWTQMLETESDFSGFFMTAFGRDEKNIWRRGRRADPTKLDTYVRNVGTPKAKLYQEAIDNHIDGQIALAKDIADVYELDGAFAKKLTDLEANGAKMRSTFKQTSDDLKLANQLREMMAGADDDLALLPAFAQKFAGSAIMRFAAVENVIRKQDGAIAKAWQGFVSRASKGGDVAKRAAGSAGKAARRIAAPTTVQILNSAKFGDSKDDHKSKQQAYRARMQELSQSATNPTRLTERIVGRVGQMEQVAPRTAQAVAGAASNAAAFLYSKAPKDPLPPMPGVKREYQPPDSEIDKWSRYVEAVDDPMAVLDHVRDGTLTREHVEAIKTIYPKLYTKMVTELVGQLDELESTAPYKDRVQLSVLFDVPFDVTMDPSFVRSMQELYETPGAVEQAGGPADQAAPSGPTLKSIRELTLPNRMQSRAQDISGGIGR